MLSRGRKMVLNILQHGDEGSPTQKQNNLLLFEYCIKHYFFKCFQMNDKRGSLKKIVKKVVTVVRFECAITKLKSGRVTNAPLHCSCMSTTVPLENKKEINFRAPQLCI